jgi:hypothetical protein
MNEIINCVEYCSFKKPLITRKVKKILSFVEHEVSFLCWQKFDSGPWPQYSVSTRWVSVLALHMFRCATWSTHHVFLLYICMQFSSLPYQLRDPPISFSVTWTLYLHYFLKQSPPTSSHFLSFGPKHSPEHPALKHSKCVLIPSKGERLCTHKIREKLVWSILIFTYLDSTIEDKKKSLTVRQKPFPKFDFEVGCVKVNCPGCRQKKLDPTCWSRRDPVNVSLCVTACWAPSVPNVSGIIDSPVLRTLALLQLAT